MEKTVICDICEKVFITTTNRKYCDEDCAREGRKRRQTEYMRLWREKNTIKKTKKAEEVEETIIIPEKFLKRY